MDLSIPREFSEDPYLSVLLFDIDHDGIPEALVTYRLWNTSGSGYNGWDWAGYKFKNGRWQEAGGDMIESSWDGFRVLTEAGQKPKLLASTISLKKGDDIEDDEVLSAVYHVTLDDAGHFKAIPLPDFKLKSPSDKLEPVQVETLSALSLVGKTFLYEKRNKKNEATKVTAVTNYVWATPVKMMPKPSMVTTNYAMLPMGLQEAIIKLREDRGYPTPRDYIKADVFFVNLNGNGEPEFFVENVGWLPDVGRCIGIFRKTGDLYSHSGDINAEFTEFALHEKVNGWHSIECHYPAGDKHYIRELYVFDGKRYHITVRSWCKHEMLVSKSPLGITER